ncbi:MAG: glycosyltransferase [Arenicella sp.]|jgi:predicted glycosyltransferase involved in capsule biosynthesis|nr:glycosyltransferase [Arenicella sp.]
MNQAPTLSYLITFRESNSERTRVLSYILQQVNSIRGMEVCLVEQDYEPRIASLVRRYSTPSMKYIFVENSGLFNKSWGLNIAAQHSSRSQLIFADADMLISNQALETISQRLGSEVDAINPYNKLIDLTSEETHQLLDNAPELNISRSTQQINRQQLGQHPPFCGGIFAVTRQLFDKCGGMDERFEGWGGEDDAMSHRISNHSSNSITLEQTAYHLWHGRQDQAQYSSPAYIRNLALLSLYYENGKKFYSSIAQTDSANNAKQFKYALSNLETTYSKKKDHSNPTISCLCVTRGRPNQLAKAIACFTNQDYVNKELLIVVEDDDQSTLDYLENVGHSDISISVVPARPKKTLGELRNLSIEDANGDYICQWDDDDWYHPKRLSFQVQSALTSNKGASILSRWLIYDILDEQVYCSNVRLWEGSLVCRKDVLPRNNAYSIKQKGEDSDLVAWLFEQDQLAVADCPELYVYHFNGANTWDANHFKKILDASQKLELKDSAFIRKKMHATH